MGNVLWSDELATGHDELDLQHRRMLGYIAEVQEQFEAGALKTIAEVLDRVVAHVTEHFTLEERHMSATGFPGLEGHRRQHRTLVADLVKFGLGSAEGAEEPVRVARMVTFLQAWAKEHITGHDQSFVGHLRAQPTADRRPGGS